MESSFLTSDARTGIRTLKQFGSLLSKTSERLATGLKVNRASDNPTAFFTAKSLNDRAGDLNRLLDGIGTRIGTVQTAEVGLRALESLVRVAQAVVDSAATLPTPRPTATGTANVAGHAQVTDIAGVADGDQISVQVGTQAAVTVTISDGDTPDALVAQLNAIDNVEASLTSAGALQISTTNGEDLTLGDVTGAALAGLGISAGTFDQASATSPERAAKAAAFDAVRSQIDQFAGDASFLGVNMLAGDSPVVSFNADGSSSLTLSGSVSSASGLGIAPAANGFGSDADIASARADLKGALGSLRGFSSRLSTNLAVVNTRQEFTANIRNVLQSGAASLTLADLNQESANLLAIQTRSALASESFSIGRASESSILRLF